MPDPGAPDPGAPSAVVLALVMEKRGANAVILEFSSQSAVLKRSKVRVKFRQRGSVRLSNLLYHHPARLPNVSKRAATRIGQAGFSYRLKFENGEFK